MGNTKSVNRKPKWGTCPVCFHIRRYDANGEMKPHRMWVSGFECGIKNCTEDHPYGYMKPCSGTGKAYLPDLTGTQIREIATR